MSGSKKSPSAPQETPDEPTFEAAMESLREIVDGMEEGSLPLDKMIERYEQGVALAAKCSKALDAAAERVKMIAESADGAPVATAFEDATDE